MTLSPLTNIQIKNQDSLIEFVRRDAFDEAFITTTLETVKPITDDEDGAVLVLPMGQGALQRPLLRYVGEDVADPGETMAFDTDVDRSEADQRVVEAFAQLEGLSDELAAARQEVANAIKDTAGTMSTTTLRAKPGQTQLRFFTTVKVPRSEDGEYVFETLAPLATFVLQNGGEIRVIAALPAGATKLEATALQNPEQPNSDIAVAEASIANRTVLGWSWRTDPFFRIKYRY